MDTFLIQDAVGFGGIVSILDHILVRFFRGDHWFVASHPTCPSLLVGEEDILFAVVQSRKGF
jgi:hypothetical protein